MLLFFSPRENNLTFFPLALLVVPMIRSHKWEWGPPTHRHHPALLCHHCTMPPQTQLRLLNLTGFSLLISLHRSPFKTTASLWTTGKTQNMWETHAEGISVVAASLIQASPGFLPTTIPFWIGGPRWKPARFRVSEICVFYERLAPGLVHFSRRSYLQRQF